MCTCKPAKECRWKPERASQQHHTVSSESREETKPPVIHLWWFDLTNAIALQILVELNSASKRTPYQRNVMEKAEVWKINLTMNTSEFSFNARTWTLSSIWRVSKKVVELWWGFNTKTVQGRNFSFNFTSFSSFYCKKWGKKHPTCQKKVEETIALFFKDTYSNLSFDP